MSDAGRRGRRNRANGRDEQSRIVRELEALGFEAEVVSRRRDQSGVDIEAVAPCGAFRLAIQSRRGVRPDPRKALADAIGGADETEIPAAVCRWAGREGGRANLRALVLNWNDERVRALLRQGAGIAAHEVTEILRNNTAPGDCSGGA